MRSRKWIQAAICIFFSLYIFDTLLTGRINLYINSDRFVWLTWLAAFLLLAMGGAQVFELMRTQPQPASNTQKTLIDTFAHDPAQGGGHAHAGHAHAAGSGAPGWSALAVIGVPLLIALVIPAKPLLSAAVQTGGISGSYGSNKVDILSIASTDRSVLDWVRAFSISKDATKFSGQPADIIGFVYRDITLKGDAQFRVMRFAVSCCVADASALGVIVQSSDAAAWVDDTWVRVSGKFAVQQFQGEATPILVAEKVEQVAQPKQPYLYP